MSDPRTKASRQVRATHPYGFRSGEWADLIGVVNYPPPNGSARSCYHVAFATTRQMANGEVLGDEDFWPVDDTGAGYEFREVNYP